MFQAVAKSQPGKLLSCFISAVVNPVTDCELSSKPSESYPVLISLLKYELLMVEPVFEPINVPI